MALNPTMGTAWKVKLERADELIDDLADDCQHRLGRGWLRRRLANPVAHKVTAFEIHDRGLDPRPADVDPEGVTVEHRRGGRDGRVLRSRGRLPGWVRFAHGASIRPRVRRSAAHDLVMVTGAA